MSLIPKNVFDDAKILCRTYRNIERLAKSSAKKVNRKGSRNHPSSRGAKRALQRLNRKLLDCLSPEVFADVVFLEWLEGRTDPGVSPYVVCKHLFKLGSASPKAAKKLAHLMVQITFFPLGDTPDEKIDSAFDLMFVSAVGYLPFDWKGSIIVKDKCFQNAEGYFLRLVESASGGDERAFDYLRLFFRGFIHWGRDIIPVDRQYYCQEFYDRFVRATLHEKTIVDGAKIVATTPIPYSASSFQTLWGVREREESYRKENLTEMDVFLDHVRSVSLTAYDHFLNALWSFLLRLEEPRLALSDGRDKVSMLIPNYQAMGIHSFAFIRESRESGWLPYPAIKVNFFERHLCETGVHQIELSRDGSLREFGHTDMDPQLLAMLWCIVFDAYAEVVVPEEMRGAKHNPRRALHGRIRREYSSSNEGSVVHAYFRKLPEGWQARPEQIALSKEQTGMAPPPGKTFVSEFVRYRGIPGDLLSLEESDSLWEKHERIEPRLTVTLEAASSLLEDISLFV